MEKMKLDIQLFNGSVAIQTITETTDDSLNQSTFTIPAKMTATGSTYNNSNASMTLQWKYESASSWTSLSKQTFKIGKNSSVTKSWTLTLDHNPDGTLANIQFRVKWYITDSTKGTTGATTFEPTTIPRASQPTLNYSSREFGQSVVITTNRYSSSFTHTLTYAFSGTTGTIATNVGPSYTWTIPNSLMNSIPNSTSGSCVITCKTYNGSTLVGTTYVSLTLNVPSSVVPTISNITQQEVGDVPSSWNTAVQNKSKLKFTITASGAYSSTISSYEIKGDGYTYTTNPATTNYIRSSGSMTFDFKVVDSRGRVATTSLTRVPESYSNPTISTAQVQRCNVSGVIDNNGEYMYISYGGSISSCNGYNKSYAVYKVGYRVHNTGSYTYVQLGTNANSYSASGMLFTDGIKTASSNGTKVQFSLNNTYDIQFYVQDYFTNSTNVQSLDAGFDLMNFNASGKAMAIGKVSEAGANEELLEIGMVTDLTTPTDKWTGLNIYSSNRNEASVAYHNQARNQRYVVGYGTNNFDGFGVYNDNNGNVLTISNEGNVSAKQSFRIPKNDALGAGLTNSDGVSIIRDHNNSNITIDATGGGIYFGYDTTNYIDFFRGLASINNAGGFHAKTIQQQIVSNGTGATSGVYVKLCNLTFGFHNQGEFANFRIYIGDGNNGRDNQNAFIDLTMQLGWTGNNDGRLGCNWELHPLNTNFDLNNVNVIVIANSNINYDIYLWTDKYYCVPNYTYDCSSNVIITNDGSTSTTYPSGTQCDIRGEVIGNTAQIGDTSTIDMPHHFQIGEILICFGIRNIHSVANDHATDTVGFGAYFRYPPIVTVTAMTAAPNTYEKGAGVSNITTDRFDLTHYRTNNTTTGYQWIAIGLRA